VYQTAIRVLASGERALFLLDGQGCPLFYPTLFTTSQLRNAGASANTIKNKLAHVVVLLRWQEDRKRDLVDDFRSGRFLTVADIVSLRDFAQRDMRDVGRVDKRPRRPGVVLLEGRTAQSAPRPSVGGPQHYSRLTTIADYLAFLATAVTQHKASAHDAVQIERMVGLIRKHRPRGISRGFDDDPHTKSPPSDLIDRFMDVVAVDHPDNPFRDPGIRLRNAILFGLFRHTGIRRGELLSLRVGDMDVGHEPIVWVRRNHDDVADPRRYQPVAKTKERPLPIPLKLATQIQDYILLSHRAKIPGARRHGYLLVSHKKGATFGQPLSLTALGSQIMG
jgi:integrase